MGHIQKKIEKRKCAHHKILYFEMEALFSIGIFLKNGHKPSNLEKYASGPSLSASSYTGLLYPNVWLVCPPEFHLGSWRVATISTLQGIYL